HCPAPRRGGPPVPRAPRPRRRTDAGRRPRRPRARDPGPGWRAPRGVRPAGGRGTGRGVADSAGPTEDLLIALSNFTHDSEYGRKLHSAPRERGEGARSEERRVGKEWRCGWGRG